MRRRLIERYILAALLPYTALALLILTATLLTQQSARFAEVLGAAHAPLQLAAEITFYLLPNILIFTLPMAVLVGIGAVAVTYLLLRRRLGLALTAIRDSEQSAQSLGVPVFRTKFAVYLVAAFGCSLAGAVIYLNLLRVQPEAAFSVNWTAFMIFIVVIGGVGTIEGPIIGTIVFFVLQETLSGYGAWYLVLLGAVAVVVTLVARRGLWGLVADRTGWSLFPVQRRLEER